MMSMFGALLRSIGSNSPSTHMYTIIHMHLNPINPTHLSNHQAALIVTEYEKRDHFLTKIIICFNLLQEYAYFKFSDAIFSIKN